MHVQEMLNQLPERCAVGHASILLQLLHDIIITLKFNCALQYSFFVIVS